MKKHKLFDVPEHDALLIHYALKSRLEAVTDDLNMLLISRDRNLANGERELLPSTLQGMTREQLREQIDPWVSLQMHYKALTDEFNPDNWI